MIAFRSLAVAFLPCVLLVVGCHQEVTPPAVPPTPPKTPSAKQVIQEEKPPEIDPFLTPRMPIPANQTLATGLSTTWVQSNSPTIELRLVIRGAGSAAEEDTPGVAFLCASTIEHQLQEQLTPLGLKAHAKVLADGTIFSFSMPEALFPQAMKVIAQKTSQATFPVIWMKRWQEAEQKRRTQAALSDTTWMLEHVLFTSLYDLPTTPHPYANLDPIAEQISILKLTSAAQFYQANYAPENVLLLVASSKKPAQLESLIKKYWSSWKRTAVPSSEPTSPVPSPKIRITLVDHKNAPYSQVAVARLGVERRGSAWVSMQLLSEIVGGNTLGRIKRELTDHQNIAGEFFIRLPDRAFGPSPVVAQANCEQEHLLEVLSVLINQMESLGKEKLDVPEIENAKRRLMSSRAIQLGSADKLADWYAQNFLYQLTFEEAQAQHKHVATLKEPEIKQALRQQFSEATSNTKYFALWKLKIVSK
jgi:zinc protease